MKVITPFLFSFLFSAIITFLIVYHILSHFNKPLIEAATNPEYNDYPKNDALILAKQNAGNIKFLKQKFETIDGLSKKINTMSENVDSNTEALHQILKAQKEQTNKLKMDNSQ